MVYWVPVFVWAGVIFFFSSLQVEISPEFDLQDFLVKKTAHIIEYAILFTLIYRALINAAGFTVSKSFKVAFILIFLYAISDEYHQSFTPGRTPSIRDVGFDSSGAVLAWIGLWKYLPKAPKKLLSWARTLQLL